MYLKQEIQEEKVVTTQNVVFKKVFASPENNHILIGFINDLLGLGITSVTVEDTYNIKSFYNANEEPEMRYTEVDVLARTDDGIQVNIEMQVCHQAWFRQRALYYTTSVYGSNYGKTELEDNSKSYAVSGRKYSALRPTYGIFIIVDNVFKEDSKPIHQFALYDRENNLLLCDHQDQVLMGMFFLELNKPSSDMKIEIKRWVDYFNSGKVAADAPDYLKKACEIASFNNLSEEEVNMISAREKAQQDAGAREAYLWYSGVEEGEEKGRTEGLAVGRIEGLATGRVEGLAAGRVEGKSSIIEAMLTRGKTVKEIVDLTGITEDEIKTVLKNVQ